MKKILFALLLAAFVPNIAIAHEFKTPLASGVVAQFDDIIINGQTANEAFSSTKQKMLDSVQAAIDANNASMNEAWNKYNAKYKQERAMANIVSRMNAYGGNNSYNYLPTAGGYIHWLALQGTEEGCFHTSVAALEQHATLFEERVELWFDYINKKQTATFDEDKIINAMTHKYVNEILVPFAKAKEEKILAEAEEQNEKIKDYNCRVVVGTKINTLGAIGSIFGIGTSGASSKLCKDEKKCKILPIYNNDILELGCACGHPLSDHKFKYKK